MKVSELPFDLSSIVEDSLSTASPVGCPVLVQMLGVPGSGKTSFARAIQTHLLEEPGPHPTFVGFDGIMSEISGYRSEDSAAAAFSKYELPARAAGYVLLEKLLERRASVMFDHGGADARHPEIIRYARSRFGYKSLVIYVRCDIATAKKRILLREATEGRHTPEEYVDERHKTIEALLQKYMANSDSFIAIDNNNLSSEKIFGLCSGIASIIRSI